MRNKVKQKREWNVRNGIPVGSTPVGLWALQDSGKYRLTIEAVKKLFNGETVPFTGKLHSPKHDQAFNVQDAKLQLFREKDNPNKFHLSRNGQNILDGFKQKYKESKQSVRLQAPAKLEESKTKVLKDNWSRFTDVY